MIEVILSDGTRRRLEDAKVSLTWEAEEDPSAVAEYTLDDVSALVLLSPMLGTMAGMFRGMPIMGIRYSELMEGRDMVVEVPIPLGIANDLGHQLVQETDRFAATVKAANGDGGKALERFGTLPADLPPPPGS